MGVGAAHDCEGMGAVKKKPYGGVWLDWEGPTVFDCRAGHVVLPESSNIPRPRACLKQYEGFRGNQTVSPPWDLPGKPCGLHRYSHISFGGMSHSINGGSF